jgi:lathosterol oxidase
MIFLLLLHIVSYDIWFYMSHLALHHPILWQFHKLHHTKSDPVFYEAYVGHPVEHVFQTLGLFFPLFFTLHVPSLATAFVFVNIRGLLQHDKRCIWLIGNHHLLHHKYYVCNYGQYWIDFCMGTIHEKNKIKN